MPRMAAAAISVDQAILIPTARKQNTVFCVSRYGRLQSANHWRGGGKCHLCSEGAAGPAAAVSLTTAS